MKYNINEIKSPDFIKELSTAEINILANDIRTFLIDSISKTGGHLSSNLGVVELTLALHKVFNTPKDKFVFDVSHQSYIHKILTGRANEFDSLRKINGLAGFTNINESIHDCFGTGHSSTSISAVAGFELSKDINDEIGHTISIIGDGSINCGLAFEGLNFLGQFQDKNPIIILNDNEMSISENVGAISKAVQKIRVSKKVTGFRKITRKIFPNFIRTPFRRMAKSLVTDKNIFEDLGYYYLGPVDGHNFDTLIKYLNISKNKKMPVLLHVVTKKGNGYKYAEEDKIGSWHGTSSFEITSGNKLSSTKSGKVSWSKAISEILIELSKEDKTIKVITPAMIQGSSLSAYQNLFPKRIFDVGIAESHAATMAASMALSKSKPFLSIYSTFSQRAYDQISHDIARQNAKVILGIDRSGLVGADGETHHGIYDIPMLSHIPNVTIVSPRSVKEAFNLLKKSFNDYDNCIAIRYPRGNVNFNKEEDFTDLDFKLSEWELVSSGDDITIISFSNSIDLIERTCKENNIDASIINARFIKPLDEKMLKKIANSKKPVLVYEESILNGGLFSMINNFYTLNNIQVSLYSMAINDQFVTHGEHKQLLELLQLDSDSIIKRCHEIINKK